MEHDQAVSCIDLVRRFTATSISSEDFKLSLRLVWFSRIDLNLSQSIRPWMRLGCFGLFKGAVSIVRRTDEWSEHKSFRLDVKVCRLFGILDTKKSRMSGLFLGEVGQ